MSAAEDITPNPAAAALSLGRRGFHVFPLLPNEKRPFGWSHGVKDATRDPAQIRAWWAEHPDANVAIAAGASGLVILDVDGWQKGNGADGFKSLAELELGDLGQLPRTRMVKTPTGGLHLYFRAPEGVEIKPSAGKLGPNLDVRAGASYVVAPPSAINSTPYAWIDNDPIQDLPEAWVARLAELSAPPPKTLEPMPRYETLADVEKRAIAYIAPIDGAVSGSGGHLATWKVAVVLARGFDLDEHTTFRILRDHYNPKCAPPWSERELMHKAKQARNARLPAGYLLRDDRPWAPDRYQVPPEPGREQPVANTNGATTAPVKASSWLDAWPSLAELGPWLTEPPPPKEWLLTRTDEDTGESKGLLARSVVGMLTAPGGRGKSWALVQLAISIATGRPWLDTFAVEHPGNVLLAIAEEDQPEMRRRLYSVARALNLSAEERRAAEARIVPLGLAGELVGLVQTVGGSVGPSELHAAMCAKLAEREWSLIILDPLSRWAPGAENSNDAATLAISLLEVFTKAPGQPNVVFAHHTAKWAAREGNKADAPGSRGVSGLRDAVRWEAKLTGSSETDLAFAVTKANGAPPSDPLNLMRDPDTGVLRPLSLAEDAARTSHVAAKQAALLEAVVSAVSATPGLGTVALREALKGKARARDVDQAAQAAVLAGLIVDMGTSKRHAYHLPSPNLSACPDLSQHVPDSPTPDLSACPVPIGTGRRDSTSGQGNNAGERDRPGQPDDDLDDFVDEGVIY